MMFRRAMVCRAMVASLVVGVSAIADAQQVPPAQAPPKPKVAKRAGAAAKVEPPLDPKALEVLKAMSARLAAAHTMAFTAVATYESPSRVGPALAYTTTSQVTLQRPDKLRVITAGDGPASEFYCDGKMMMAFAPAENLVAVAAAPPTIDATLKAAYDSAAIYFPFADVVVADPYKDIADGLQLAFYIGQSHVVGGTTTDIVAFASDAVFVQAWIGAEDKLPRMVRAVFRNDPLQLRNELELSSWQLDLAVPPDAFASTRTADAKRIEFARPDPKVPLGAAAGKGKPLKARVQPPTPQP